MTDCFNNLRIISAERIRTANTINITSLSYHALLIRANEKVIYTFGNEKITSVRGDIVFIPGGSSYTVKPIGGENDYATVRFTADIAHGLEIMRADDLAEALSIHAALARATVFEDRHSRLTAISHFYRLLALASPRDTEHTGLGRRKLSLIRPAIKHLEENIFSTELVLSELSQMCGISDVYFRKLFREHTGMLPQRYVSEKRLERAAAMLYENPTERIKDVALAVGYVDPLYFSRIYKRKYGNPPSFSAENNILCK